MRLRELETGSGGSMASTGFDMLELIRNKFGKAGDLWITWGCLQSSLWLMILDT